MHAASVCQMGLLVALPVDVINIGQHTGSLDFVQKNQPTLPTLLLADTPAPEIAIR